MRAADRTAKSMAALQAAAVGDIVVALDGCAIAAMEQVGDGIAAVEIVERWAVQHVIGEDDIVEVWECRPGSHYRRRGPA